jgi:hypothetical protein
MSIEGQEKEEKGTNGDRRGGKKRRTLDDEIFDGSCSSCYDLNRLVFNSTVRFSRSAHQRR